MVAKDRFNYIVFYGVKRLASPQQYFKYFRPAYYRWGKTPDIQLSIRAHSSIWIDLEPVWRLSLGFY